MNLHQLSIGIALVLVSSPAASEPIVIRFSHVVAEDTPKGFAARRFEELAEAYTRGAVDVQVFPNSTLYSDREELEALQLGSVEILAPSMSKFAPLGITAFEVFDLPYLFADSAAVHRVTDGPIGQALLASLRGKGIVGLAFWDNGFKIMSATRPVRVPADFEGLVMRIQPSRTLDAQMRALGALPHAMALSEVRGAIEAGAVDGTENPPSNLLTQRMYELQPHATLSWHGYLGYAVIANAAFWDGLPADVRDGLERALDAATVAAADIAEESNAAALAEVRLAGTTTIHELSAEELAAWKDALRPVAAEMRERIGPDLIERVYAELGLPTGSP